MPLVKRIRTRFIDLDLNFQAHPSTKDISKLTDARAIGRSIRNLVFMQKYDYPFHPEIAGDVTRLLFEPLTNDLVTHIQKTIEYLVINFEPRAELVGVNVTPNYSNNSIAVVVVYKIVGLAELYQVAFDLERTI